MNQNRFLYPIKVANLIKILILKQRIHLIIWKNKFNPSKNKSNVMIAQPQFKFKKQKIHFLMIIIKNIKI